MGTTHYLFLLLFHRSALNGSNVEAAFVCMTAKIKESVDRRGLGGLKITTSNLQNVGGVQLATKERKAAGGCGCG